MSFDQRRGSPFSRALGYTFGTEVCGELRSAGHTFCTEVHVDLRGCVLVLLFQVGWAYLFSLRCTVCSTHVFFWVLTFTLANRGIGVRMTVLVILLGGRLNRRLSPLAPIMGGLGS